MKGFIRHTLTHSFYMASPTRGSLQWSRCFNPWWDTGWDSRWGGEFLFTSQMGHWIARPYREKALKMSGLSQKAHRNNSARQRPRKSHDYNISYNWWCSSCGVTPCKPKTRPKKKLSNSLGVEGKGWDWPCSQQDTITRRRRRPSSWRPALSIRIYQMRAE